MNENDFQHEQWRTAASRLKAQLDVDYRNHQVLVDPWARAAHCMVQSWRNIASQGRLAYTPDPHKRHSTWKEAAKSMKASLDSRKRSRLSQPNDLAILANHIPRVELRYIPKQKRRAQGVA